MRIRWLGHATFLLTGEANTVAIDPYGEFPEDRRIKFDYPSLEGIEADVVLVTHEHMDHNAVDVIGGDPEVLRAGAGTFDSRLGKVVGIASEHDQKAGTQRGPNTIFCFEIDGVRYCHFGDFGQAGLRPEQREAIGEVDVLFLPVGGGPTIDGSQAARLVAELRPHVAIPMHYGTEAADFVEGPEKFLDAVSADIERLETSEVEPREYLNGDGTTVLVLQAPLAC
jgi:L-ascorbate metabolism protein UlaG (beta-lactamase superfamily)